MITAQGQRNFSCFKRLNHQFRVLGAGRRDFLQIFGVRVAFFFLLRYGHGNVAAIFHLMPQRFQPRLEPRHSDGRRPHIDATPGLAQIERHADHPNLLGRNVRSAYGRHKDWEIV